MPGLVRANVLDANFTASVWLATDGSATGMAWAPDGSNRLFITVKEGAVRIVENGALVVAPFATETVHTNSECGIIGIAFDPNFVQNKYVYVFATISSSEQQIIRYTANGNVAADRTVIVRNLPTAGNNHDGGAVGFGPDGKLYWAIGDLGNGTGVDGDLTSLAAKLGRANRDGTVPNDNPFFDGDGPNNDYIWARGFRNPFTFTFQPSTDALWVNTVGTNWEQVFVVGAGQHAGYNDYENNQPNGYLAPVIAYRTNSALSSGLEAASGAVRSGGVVTFTTMSTLGLRKGMKVTVAGVTDSSFDADYFVASVPSATTFTAVTQSGGDATSGGGMATTIDIGGSITGGAFLDTSAVPLDYRDNFFFADYNTHRVERVTLAGDNSVETIDHWATDITSATDVALGPDGALYLLEIDGDVHRASFNASVQGLVVTPLHVRMDEAGSAVVNVRLATAPANDVSVTAAVSGDGDLAVSAGSTLTFTAANWQTPQVVEIGAARDTDVAEDTGELTLSAAGLGAQPVTLRVTDEGNITFIASSSQVDVTEGSTAMLAVSLSRAPVAPVPVLIARSSGDASVTITQGAQLLFTPENWSIAQTVSIAAAQDDDNQAETAQVTIAATAIPSRVIAVHVNDDDDASPDFISTPVRTGVVGAPYGYDADADGLPAPTYSLTQKPDGMAIDGATGVISWTPDAAGTFAVVVRAENGVEPAGVQSFEIVVTADQAPACSITQPLAGETIRGDRAEFYGDVMDDVRAVRAEFSVDGEVRSTDVNDDGHYHFSGAHNEFDTTAYADGEHDLSFVGYDNRGQMCTASVRVTIANGSSAADGGTPSDAGEQTDAGVSDASTADAGPATSDDDCSCRVAGAQRPFGVSRLALTAFVLLGWVVRIRRRRSSRRRHLPTTPTTPTT